jgi:hypothetical protein
MPEILQGPTRSVLNFPLGTDIDPRIISDISKSTTPEHVTAVNNGNTTVHTTTAGKYYKVKMILVFNSSAATVTVYLRDGAAGSAMFQAALAANTGYLVNLIGCNWLLTVSTNLVVNLSGASTVDVTISGEEV